MICPAGFICLPEGNPLTEPFDLFGLWHLSIWFGLSVCITAIFWRRDLPFVARALWAYVLVMAVYTIEFPALIYGDYNTAYQAAAGQALAEAVLIPMALLSISDRTAWRILRWLKWPLLGKLMIFWLTPWVPAILRFICYKHQAVADFYAEPGALLQPSFDFALLALYLPFAPAWLIVLSVGTIVTHHGSTALVVIGAELAVLGWFRISRRLFLISAPLVAGALFALAWFHHNTGLLDGDERLVHWLEYMRFWQQSWIFVAFGAGPGAFQWISNSIGKFQDPSTFVTMHNDWLGIAFDLGLAGLVMALGVTAKGVRLTRRDPRLLAGVLGSAAFALTYSPLRFFPSALLIGLIFRLALVKKEKPGFPGLSETSSI